MNRFLRIAGMILLVFAPEYATAGGWPLEKGKTFLALSASAVWPGKRPIELPDIYGSTYAEHGLGAGLTLGLDLGSPDATRKDRMKSVAFMRYTLTPSSAKHQLSLDLGLEYLKALTSCDWMPLTAKGSRALIKTVGSPLMPMPCISPRYATQNKRLGGCHLRCLVHARQTHGPNFCLSAF